LEMARFELDAEGYVVVPVDPQCCARPPSQPPEHLPIISGPNGNDVQAGHRLDSRPIQAAIELIGAFERSPMAGRADLKRIDASATDVLVATTGQGSEITFGLTGLDEQLRRWAIIYEAGQHIGKGIGTLDLAITNSIPLRLVDAS